MFPQRIRNIKKEWPLSSWAYLLSVLSLLGFPFTAGFFSKEPIVEALALIAPNAPGGLLVNCLLLVYLSATGIYLGRMSHYAFSGTGAATKANYIPLAKRAPLWTLGLLNVLLFFIFPHARDRQPRYAPHPRGNRALWACAPPPRVGLCCLSVYRLLSLPLFHTLGEKKSLIHVRGGMEK